MGRGRSLGTSKSDYVICARPLDSLLAGRYQLSKQSSGSKQLTIIQKRSSTFDKIARTNFTHSLQVSAWQTIQWMRDPQPIERAESFPPFQCDYKVQIVTTWHKIVTTRLKTVTTKYQIVTAMYKFATKRYKIVTTRYTAVTRWYKLMNTRYNIVTSRYKIVTTRYTVVASIYTTVTRRYKLVTTWYKIMTSRYGVSNPK